VVTAHRNPAGCGNSALDCLGRRWPWLSGIAGVAGVGLGHCSDLHVRFTLASGAVALDGDRWRCGKGFGWLAARAACGEGDLP
jgi:hypothetical protein